MDIKKINNRISSLCSDIEIHKIPNIEDTKSKNYKCLMEIMSTYENALNDKDIGVAVDIKPLLVRMGKNLK